MRPGRLHPRLLTCKGHLWQENRPQVPAEGKSGTCLQTEVGTSWNSTRAKGLSCTWEGIYITGWASLGSRPVECLGVYGAEHEPAVCTGSKGQRLPRLCEQDYSQQRAWKIAHIQIITNSTHKYKKHIDEPRKISAEGFETGWGLEHPTCGEKLKEQGMFCLEKR